MADRNEEKRTEIWRKIVKIEDKEDRLRATKKQYEQQGNSLSLRNPEYPASYGNSIVFLTQFSSSDRANRK